MIIKLSNGYCIDGVNQSEQRTLYLVDGRLNKSLPEGRRVDAHYDLDGSIVMAGGIDLHTHIGGGKVNLARLLLPDLRRQRETSVQNYIYGSAPLTSPVPNTAETGQRYLQMGYTTCLEPAILPANARAAHYEMADIPWLDTGGYLILGNDRVLLEMLNESQPQNRIDAYVGAMLELHQCCGVKVVNAGGIDAFKFNQRSLDVDDFHPIYRVTPREILQALSAAVDNLKLPHPLHVHCSNLGVAGNIRSTMATLESVEDRRVHLTHAQYHCYGSGGPHGYTSEASTLADYVNRHPRVTIDVGQILFGQTVTISGDTMHQYDNRSFAKPNKTIFQDAECQAGCGIVPFRYRQSEFVSGLQWTIGLELFLKILNPHQVFLTTDHPNGGPFTAYPHLIRLLSSYDYRMEIFERLHPELKAVSQLPLLTREYSLEEIAQMTRLGPAKILGLGDRGSLRNGMRADIAIYERSNNLESMFANPKMVFKGGELVWKDGHSIAMSPKQTIVAKPEYDKELALGITNQWRRSYGYSVDMVRINDEELQDDQRSIVDVFKM